MKKYSIILNINEHLDTASIVREVRENNPDTVGFILSTRGDKFAGVYLFVDFLEQFAAGNKLYVGNRPLCPGWGHNFEVDIDRANRFCFSWKTISSIPARLLSISTEDGHLEVVIDEIMQAKLALKLGLIRKINVRPI